MHGLQPGTIILSETATAVLEHVESVKLGMHKGEFTAEVRFLPARPDLLGDVSSFQSIALDDLFGQIVDTLYARGEVGNDTNV